MSILRLFDALAGSKIGADLYSDKTDERHWRGEDGSLATALLASSGVLVTGELALSVSCVFQAVRLIAEGIGGLPLIVYRDLGEKGKKRDPDSELAALLRDEPNGWQTSQEFRETLTAHALLYGAGFAEKRYDGGRVAALEPLDPETITVEQTDTDRRSLRLRIEEPGKPSRVLVQEQFLRIRGIGTHRFMGENLLRLSRHAIGLWMAQEEYSAAYFRQGASPSVWLSHPATLSDAAYRRLSESIAKRTAGLANAHRAKILEEGMTLATSGWSAKDSQMTEARESQVAEIARWFNVPEHMLRAGKTPTFASMEQFAKEFVDYTLLPWCRRWESSIRRDLVSEEDLFAEFLLDGLLRGSTKDRAESYSIFVEKGIMTRNEVRIRENLEPLEGLDEPLTPLNMERTGEDSSSSSEPAQDAAPDAPDAPSGDEESPAGASVVSAPVAAPGGLLARRLELVAEGAIARILRKEEAAVVSKAKKHAGDAAGWRAAVLEFYGAHAAHVAEALEVESTLARRYSEGMANRVLEGGVSGWAAAREQALGELRELVFGEF